MKSEEASRTRNARRRKDDSIPAWGYFVILFFVAALASAISFMVGKTMTAIAIPLLALVIWQGKTLLLLLRNFIAWVRIMATKAHPINVTKPSVVTFPEESVKADEIMGKLSSLRISNVAVLLLLGAIAFRVFCGVFVVQPIGAIPNGGTVIYYRWGLNMPFIASADGIQQKSSGQVNLIGRAVLIGGIGNIIKNRKLFSLPYFHTLYLWSTGGREYDR